MKKLALLVYPEFSLQEVMNLARLFRWDFDISTEVISSELSPVKSEEGLWVVPQKTTEQFCTKDYACLILPGCSDFSQVFQDKKIAAFLSTFQGNDTFPIGAICSAPILLARAGILDGKKFTGSIFMDFFDFCPFLQRENYQAVPLVVSGNIVTAGGGHFNGFAVAMAHLLGLECSDHIFSGYMDSCPPEVYAPHLPSESIEEAKELFDIL